MLASPPVYRPLPSTMGDGTTDERSAPMLDAFAYAQAQRRWIRRGRRRPHGAPSQKAERSWHRGKLRASAPGFGAAQPRVETAALLLSEAQITNLMMAQLRCYAVLALSSTATAFQLQLPAPQRTSPHLVSMLAPAPPGSLGEMYRNRWPAGAEAYKGDSPRANLFREPFEDEGVERATGCVAVYDQTSKTEQPICGELSFDSTDDGMVRVHP